MRGRKSAAVRIEQLKIIIAEVAGLESFAEAIDLGFCQIECQR